MKIAIHYGKGSFCESWIEYCKKNGIQYKLVNCYDSDIIKQLEDYDALMWHHHQSNYKDVLFAKQLLTSLELSGKKVFPNFNTGWHFDDKVGQKYLLEAIGAPLVPTYVFYGIKDALEWANQVTYPKVFKLRGGAGSANVKLIKSKRQAIHVINKAFQKGFSPFDKWENLKERIYRYRSGRDNLLGIGKGLFRLFVPTEYAKKHPHEKGYVYFQDFIPDNNFDIRVIVIGNKAFAIKRMVRNNDFRASGSGMIIYDKKQIPEICIQIAFEVNACIKSQSIAYDFVFEQNKPLILEISYGFVSEGYTSCEGYWDSNLVWYKENFNPLDWIIENLIENEC